jgi:hypothetical protein
MVFHMILGMFASSKKALYGLKQAPHTLFEKFSKYRFIMLRFLWATLRFYKYGFMSSHWPHNFFFLNINSPFLCSSSYLKFFLSIYSFFLGSSWSLKTFLSTSSTFYSFLHLLENFSKYEVIYILPHSPRIFFKYGFFHGSPLYT